jgi:hypothetical protein
MMRNIQIIDGALNYSYSIYAVTEEDFFQFVFPDLSQDVEFIEDVMRRRKPKAPNFRHHPAVARQCRDGRRSAAQGTGGELPALARGRPGRARTALALRRRLRMDAIAEIAALVLPHDGRTYRGSPTKDKMWNLHRGNAVSDKEGHLIGKYRGGGDASKVIKQMAYQPEPWW